MMRTTKQMKNGWAGAALVAAMAGQGSAWGAEADNGAPPPVKSVARAAEASAVIPVWSTRKMPGTAATAPETETLGSDGDTALFTNTAYPQSQLKESNT